MKNKKLLLRVGIFVIIGFLVVRFVINYISESKDIGNINTDSESINKTESLENDYKIIESSNESCTQDKDCELSPLFMSGYAFRSDCPYQSKCIENACTIVCPYFGVDREKVKKLIQNCEVKEIAQAHSLRVQITLKNGDMLDTREPSIDDVFAVVEEARSKCGEIYLMTE